VKIIALGWPWKSLTTIRSAILATAGLHVIIMCVQSDRNKTKLNELNSSLAFISFHFCRSVCTFMGCLHDKVNLQHTSCTCTFASCLLHRVNTLLVTSLAIFASQAISLVMAVIITFIRFSCAKSKLNFSKFRANYFIILWDVMQKAPFSLNTVYKLTRSACDINRSINKIKTH